MFQRPNFYGHHWKFFRALKIGFQRPNFFCHKKTIFRALKSAFQRPNFRSDGLIIFRALKFAFQRPNYFDTLRYLIYLLSISCDSYFYGDIPTLGN